MTGIHDALEDLAGWLDAASSPDEPGTFMPGKVSAAVLAQRIRAIAGEHPEGEPAYEYGVATKWGQDVAPDQDAAEKLRDFHRSSGEEARLVKRKPGTKPGPWEVVE